MGIGDIAGFIIGASISNTWLGTVISGAVIGVFMAIIGQLIADRNSETVRASGVPFMIQNFGMSLLIAMPEFVAGSVILRAVGIGARYLFK